MGLNTRSIFDPRFTTAIAKVAQGGMTSSVLVRRKLPGVEEGQWDYETGGYRGNDFVTLWNGPARVQPNKDWRARSYDMGDESVVFHACRFHLPIADGEWNPDVPADEREFRDQDEVLIVTNFFPQLQPLLRFVFTVRNPMGSGNAGVRGLLCDVNLKGGLSRGNPQ